MRSAATSTQRGSVAVITGLTIAVLIGFLGLAVDLGRLFVIKAELQTGMDACALAAATQLRPGLNDPNALDRAIAFGRTPPNLANFQDEVIDPEAIEFAFSPDLAGPYTAYGGGGGAGALASTAQYVRCTYPLAQIPVYFMRVISSITEATVAATAVATLAPSQTSCGFPTAVCRDSTASANSSPPWGLQVGTWTSGLGDTGGGSGGPSGCTSGTGSGNFCWLDYSPPSGGASELSALIKGQGQCELTISNSVGQTGVIASLVGAWNTRFGIYKSNEIPKGASGELANAPPDVAGYSYTASNWPTQFNAYPDFTARRSANTPFNAGSGDGGSGIDVPGGAVAITSALHAKYGRDRRLVLAPIVDCSVFASSQTVSIDAWACMLLLAPISNPGGGSFSAKLEYLGLASAAGSACATSGLGGGTEGPLVPVLVQ